jgi:hypothetical protein
MSDIIDRIAEARRRNNVNWMKILQIAIDRDPVETKRVLRHINHCDQEISALTRDLCRADRRKKNRPL